MKIGEIRGLGRVTIGWHSFDDVRYRLEVAEEQHRRRLVRGNIEADPEVIKVVDEFGEAVIALGGGLGTFGFIVTNVAEGAIEIIGPVTSSSEVDKGWR